MGKEKIFEKLYSDHSPELFRFCKFHLNNDEDAQDIVSESFIKLYENDDFHFINNKRAWLFKVSRNMIYNHTNKENAKEILYADDFEDEVDLGIESFEKEVVNELTIEYLEKEMKKLDAVTSDIIIMKIWDSMSFKEIATIIEMSVDAVKKRFYRGIHFLKLSVSREEKSLNVKSITIPFLLAGILGISSQPAYAFSSDFSISVFSTISSALNLSPKDFTLFNFFNTMENDSVNNTYVTSQDPSGILASTTSKVIAGLSVSLALIGIGAGLAFVIFSNNYSPTPVPPIATPDNNNTDNNDREDSEDLQENETDESENEIDDKDSEKSSDKTNQEKDTPSRAKSNDESLSEPVILTKTCSFPSVGIEFKIPEDWNCHTEDFAGTVGTINIENPWFYIYFDNQGKGTPCHAAPPPPGRCSRETFVETDYITVEKVWFDGRLSDIAADFRTNKEGRDEHRNVWILYFKMKPDHLSYPLVVNARQEKVLKAVFESIRF